METIPFNFYGEKVVLRSILSGGTRWYVANDIGKLLTRKPNDMFSKICPSRQSSVGHLLEPERRCGLHPFNKLVTAEGIMEVISRMRPTTAIVGVRDFVLRQVFTFFGERIRPTTPCVLYVSDFHYSDVTVVTVVRVVVENVSWFAVEPFLNLILLLSRERTSGDETTPGTIFSRVAPFHVRRFFEFGPTTYAEDGVVVVQGDDRCTRIGLTNETVFVDGSGLFQIIKANEGIDPGLCDWIQKNIFVNFEVSFVDSNNDTIDSNHSDAAIVSSPSSTSGVIVKPIKRLSTTKYPIEPRSKLMRRIASLEQQLSSYREPVVSWFERYERFVVRCEQYAARVRLDCEKKIEKHRLASQKEIERHREQAVLSKIACERAITELGEERGWRRQYEQEKNFLDQECRRLSSLLLERGRVSTNVICSRYDSGCRAFDYSVFKNNDQEIRVLSHENGGGFDDRATINYSTSTTTTNLP